ncbi:uncharacterized protein LOC143259097 isoform X2 [Megalopta genalis]|uniref:uncharacterized protein LOC143259097 isoform X2 n=1 Tax=Megalopta genalis TaxID=115081 RepID=UPI003FD025CE
MEPLAVQDQRVGIPRNPYYEKDVVYVFKPCKWILKSTGIWPDILEDTNKFLQKLAVGLCNVVMLFALIPFTLYLAVEEEDLMIVLSLIGLETFCWISVFKYWSLIACRPTLKHCIESIQDDWKKIFGNGRNNSATIMFLGIPWFHFSDMYGRILYNNGLEGQQHSPPYYVYYDTIIFNVQYIHTLLYWRSFGREDWQCWIVMFHDRLVSFSCRYNTEHNFDDLYIKLSRENHCRSVSRFKHDDFWKDY